mgnify:FL=1
MRNLPTELEIDVRRLGRRRFSRLRRNLQTLLIRGVDLSDAHRWLERKGCSAALAEWLLEVDRPMFRTVSSVDWDQLENVEPSPVTEVVAGVLHALAWIFLMMVALRATSGSFAVSLLAMPLIMIVLLIAFGSLQKGIGELRDAYRDWRDQRAGID